MPITHGYRYLVDVENGEVTFLGLNCRSLSRMKSTYLSILTYL